MSEKSLILFQVSSGDFSIGENDTNTSFSNQLGASIVLDNNKNYEVALYDLQFTPPRSSYNNVLPADTRSINISSNLVQSVQTGSIGSDYIYTVRFNTMNTKTVPPIGSSPTPSSSALFLSTYGNRKWYPLALKYMNRITVSLVYWDNATYSDVVVPPIAGGFTIATFAIREVD